MVELRKIVWPSDFSRQSKRALAVAVAVARADGDILTALHDVRPGEGARRFAVEM
jgi:universal stress protein family protein